MKCQKRTLFCGVILSLAISGRLGLLGDADQSKSVGTVGAQSDFIPVLITQLRKSQDIYERRRAAKALGEIGSQPRYVMVEVASALLAVSLDKDESLQYYAENALKQVRLSASDALDVWVNYPYTALGDWIGEAAAIPLLCELLNKPENLPNRSDPFLRYHTARQLLHIGSAMPDIAVPALIKALRNPEFGRVPGNDYSRDFPPQVVFALAAIGVPAIESLLETISDADDMACFYASTALSLMDCPPPSTIVPALLDPLQTGDKTSPFRFASICSVLERIGEPAKAAVPLLIDLLSDKYYFMPMQRDAAEALGAIGPEASDAVPALIKMLDAWSQRWDDSSATYVLVSVLDALGDIGPAAQVALPNIRKALEDVDIEVRIAAARALRKLKQPLSASQIIALHDEDESLNYLALVEIGKLPPPFDDAISVLLEIRMGEAPLILAEIGQPAVPALLNALNSPNPDVRRTGARALANIEELPKHALDTLIEAMHDDVAIAQSAVRGLAKKDSEQALNAVFALLKHKQKEVRLAGVNALARLETPPQRAVEPLIDVLGDAHQPVHYWAVIALRKLGTAEALQAVDRVELGLK